MTLLAASRDLGQLVILAIVFLGWVIKEVVEARKRKALRSPQPKRPDPARMPPPDRRREPQGDVVYGSRPLPHLPRSETTGQAPRAPAPRPAPSARRTERLRPAEVTGPSSVQEGGRSIETLTQTASTTFTTRTEHSRRRDRTLRRLQVGDVHGGLREKTRAGILWSEVLGPCRAFRGPHRAPTFERARRG